MLANLDGLKRQRAQFAPRNAGNSDKRRRILAALDRNNCSGDGAVGTRNASKQAKKTRRRTLLEQVFGVRTYNNRGQRDDGQGSGLDEALASRYGTFRTLCVRKSDGYYFPISFSTVPDRFDVDEQVCQAMCPTSEVGLYVHRMPSEDSEDMVSYRGDVPYSKEPFAFAYRKTHDPNNKCRFALARSADAGSTGSNQPGKAQVQTIGLPSFRIAHTYSPGAFDQAYESITLQDAKDYVLATRNADQENSPLASDSDRNVRIVGPAFFPVQ